MNAIFVTIIANRVVLTSAPGCPLSTGRALSPQDSHSIGIRDTVVGAAIAFDADLKDLRRAVAIPTWHVCAPV